MGIVQNPLSLEAVEKLAAKMETMPDDRSEELKRLQDDSHLDGVALYYRFFRELSLTMKPSLVLDVGTYRGASAAHLAANLGTRVVTIDKMAEAADRVRALRLENVQAINIGSLEYIQELERVLPKWAGIFDVVFLDALHHVDQVYQEYQEIRPFVRDGGLIFFDDTTSTEQMKALWNLIADPKLELNGLHWSGFGVVRVDYRTQLMSWSDIVGRAILKIIKDRTIKT